MTLLEEIQNAATDSTSDLGSLLRKCKILAARLGHQPLEEWLIWESNGYPEDVPVPDYRTWPVEVKGHFSGPFGSGLRDAPIPHVCLPKQVRDSYRNYKCRQSISTIETILRSGETTLQIPTGDLAVGLGTRVYQGQNCVQAWAEFGSSALLEVVNSVRNRLLDFTLALWKKQPNAGELASGLKVDQGAVTQIFNTTIYGGGANVVGVANQSNLTLNIGVGDFESVRMVLAERGVAADDLVELESALTAEPTADSKRFGPRVAGWIASMVGKAASGGWDISVATAGALLAEVISKYYGLG